MDKLIKNFKQLEQEYLEIKETIKNLEKEKKQELQGTFQVRKEEINLISKFEKLLTTLIDSQRKRKETIKQYMDIIDENISQFKFDLQYSPEPLKSPYPISLSFIVGKERKQIKSYEQKLRIAERNYLELKKSLEDEMYKMRIRTTLAEIQLKEAKERKKRN